jgi:hypothetical protein
MSSWSTGRWGRARTAGNRQKPVQFLPSGASRSADVAVSCPKSLTWDSPGCMIAAGWMPRRKRLFRAVRTLAARERTDGTVFFHFLWQLFSPPRILGLDAVSPCAGTARPVAPTTPSSTRGTSFRYCSFVSFALPGGSIMSWRSFPVVTQALLLGTAFLLTSHSVLAGETIRAAAPQYRPAPPPAPAPVARLQPFRISVTPVTTNRAQAVKDATIVELRGPDGQVRRFPVEGGKDVIQSQPVVLRPGQSISVRWFAPK